MTEKRTAQEGDAGPTRNRLVWRALSFISIILPGSVIAGLFYAALFVKPTAHITFTPPPVIEARDLFYAVIAPGDGVLWAAGNHGKVIRSEDEGRSWQAQVTGTTAHLQSMAAWDGKQAVAVGNNTTLIRTSDGGKNWEQVAAPDKLPHVKLLRVRLGKRPGSAIAVGEFGTVLATYDYGNSWTMASTGADVSWNDAVMISDREWLLVGEFGRVLRTKDAGQNWEKLESPLESSLNAVHFRDAEHGVAVGTEGKILVTADGGTTWHIVPRITHTHIYDVMWDGRRWIAVGDKGLLMTAEADATRWDDKSTATSSGWRSHIAFDGKRYALAGRGLELVVVPYEAKNAGAG